MPNDQITIKSKIEQEINDLEEDIYNTSKARNALSGGFIWSDSPQGHKYWSGVYDELTKVRDWKRDQITELAKQLDDEIGIYTDD